MDWELRLISLYLMICKAFHDDLARYSERMSSYANLAFSDEEVVTIFLMGLLDKKTEIKTIYQHAHDYWRGWFPQIQMASKVRSLNGLMVHIYGRLAAAMFLHKNKMTTFCS